MSTPTQGYGPGPYESDPYGRPGSYGGPAYPPPPPPNRNRPLWTILAVVAGVLVIGGGLAAAFTMTNSSSPASPSTVLPGNGATTGSAATSANAAGGSGSGQLVQLSADGDDVTSISYLDANGVQQTVSHPTGTWHTSFQANTSFQERLRVHGTGSVKCTVTVGNTTSQNAGMSSFGSTVTCRAPVGGN